jgi:peptidoglycan/LPS O-acetylase OafA/YrhL/CubicO group peptidase (beta-lactamase class C family)
VSQRQAAAHQPPALSPAHLPYIPGLDGVRALAVIAVLLYHAGLPVVGGFLGVESFFVLSGFLITLLLLAEWTQRDRIDLRAFWLRRARRLLPALFAMLAGVLIITGALLGGERTELGGDLLASLGYVMNWRLIASGQSYFDPLLRPSLLQHLWSLAVEEQFYLLWPLIFLGGMRLLGRARLRIATLVAALSSIALMAWLYRPGLDPSRIYYGTDTRAGGVLLGAALAMLLHRTPAPETPARWPGWLADGAGIAALGGLIACFVWVPEWHPLLYRGGFALVDVLTALVIVGAIDPRARLTPRILGWSPLRWIGLRSYGLYLWHWPIFMVTRPALDLPLDGLPLLALRLALTGILVELSYRSIELPVRGGALERAWDRWRGRADTPQPDATLHTHGSTALIRWLCLLVPILLLVGSTGRSYAPVVSGSMSGAAPSAPAAALSRAATATRPPAAAPARTAAPAAAAPINGATAILAPTAAPQPPTATPTPGVTQPLDPALIAQFQALLDETTADGAIPGATLSVSIPGYEPWSGASGWADRAEGRPMQPDTLVHISSITKMFTAVIVLQLAQEGRLDLDAPISVWLPDITPLAERTTPRHLLSHTSGIFDYLEDSRFFIDAYRNPERSYTPDELVEMVDDFGAAFEPGTEDAWKYSSTNYVILGMLVERITGRPLVEEMHTRIFTPLNLTHTFFAPYEQVAGRVAEGYIGASDRADVSMTFVFGTGNIIATADDMRIFADGLFGGALLNADSLAMMSATIDTGGAYDMPELQYGLGLMRARLNVQEGPNGERPENASTVLGHIGGIAGFRTAVWRVPDSGITIALGLNQAIVDPNVLARDTLDVILDWQGQ